MPEDTVMFWTHQLVEAIGYLHSKDILHRDIKMLNVLIDENSNLKLCDFGMSVMIPEGEQAKGMCGTPAYMAPELIKHKPYRFEPDWWSLGIILYELVNKRNPFDLRNLDNIVN